LHPFGATSLTDGERSTMDYRVNSVGESHPLPPLSGKALQKGSQAI
jgi:hypothetical protein